MIDLHIHSNYSDGKRSVSYINNLADEKNVSVLSITDHDTIESLEEIEKVRNDRIWIPGVELSTDNYTFNEKIKIHLLGYGFDCNNPYMSNKLRELYERRKTDNYEYICKMIKVLPFLSNEMFNGLDIGKYGWIYKMILNHLNEIISTENKALLIHYMDNNKPCYHNYNTPIEEAIDMISKMDGYAVIAHPFKLTLAREKHIDFIKYLKSCGLSGIEVFHKDANQEDKDYYHRVAQELELYETGGNDSHMFTKNTLGCPIQEINENSEFVKKIIKEKKTVGDYYDKK